MNNEIPEDVVLENPACPLGCSPDDRLLFSATDRLNRVGGTFSVVECASCGLLRTSPRPNQATIGRYYPPNYSPYATSRIPKNQGRARDLLKRVVRHAVLDEATPPLSPGNLLEIGCASGAFLDKMSRRGWRVRGIESSREAAANAIAAGFDVTIGQLEQVPSPNEPFDLAVGWMVVEHLHEPVEALRRVATWGREGAWLAISTPNAASLDFKLFKDRGYALQLPTHLHHFTPQTLTKVLEASGWTVRKVMHQRSEANYVLSLGYLLEDMRFPRSLTSRVLGYPSRLPLLRLALTPLAMILGLLGQSGRMTVWAQKT